MSYNVDSVEVLYRSPGASIKGTAWDAASMDDRPEECFLDDLIQPDDPDSGRLLPSRLSWLGTCSGNTFDTFIKVLGFISGEVLLLVTWEGGDSFTFLHVEGGIVAQIDGMAAMRSRPVIDAVIAFIKGKR